MKRLRYIWKWICTAFFETKFEDRRVKEILNTYLSRQESPIYIEISSLGDTIWQRRRVMSRAKLLLSFVKDTKVVKFY